MLNRLLLVLTLKILLVEISGGATTALRNFGWSRFLSTCNRYFSYWEKFRFLVVGRPSLLFVGAFEFAGAKSDECEVRAVLADSFEAVEKVRVCGVWAVEADSVLEVYRLSAPLCTGGVVEMPYFCALASNSSSS